MVSTEQATDDEPTQEKDARRAGDPIFSGVALLAGLSLILLLAGVGIFLVIQGLPALDAHGHQVYGREDIWDFAWPLLYGTVLASLIALLIAAPLSIGLALVISHYAPRALAKPVGYLVDLLAAVPSVIFGLWGLQVLSTNVIPVYRWLGQNLGFIPFFEGPTTTGSTILTAGIVLAIMALPIVTAICREIFSQTPRMHEEAALALGATRWEMIKMAVFPYSRPGVVSAIMLGLGRALGETMAVAMVLSATGVGVVTLNMISSQNPNTIAAMIANNYANASGIKVNVLIFGGLMLFVVTFLVNFLGRWIATRGQAKA